ncbi:hypothetical protein [Methanonatronarchaeum sp. AMET-Sl]|uniref:hypothetical protein n=1 Tax=Methanonatronarchaeum sp. AMET-Sl TaxID=3037654 RepID=UPI00244E5706|nr:hypothetical protein [Methanonatronarchaeum sp. AMET-Sl]WGI16648.1 hypothetical protein QEN48_03915 [Methanonatronarchaeum sp. AMET-Sl]
MKSKDSKKDAYKGFYVFIRASILGAIPLFFIHKIGKEFYTMGTEASSLIGILFISLIVFLIAFGGLKLK